MASSNRTESEALFEELCEQHSVPCRRLPESPDRQQPDYELELAGNVVVAEVKQIDPNQEDRAFNDALHRDGMATQRRNPDLVARRVRNHIKESRAQLEAYLNCHPQTAALLVLFDAARNKYTDPYTIQTAMYGWEQVVLDVPPIGQPITVADRGFAPRNNREVRPDKNEHLSALATLHECRGIEEPHERFLAMRFYHNLLAVHRIAPIWWSADHIEHLQISEKAPGNYQNCIRATEHSKPDSFTGGEE